MTRRNSVGHVAWCGLLLAWHLLGSPPVVADALIRSQAMLASTTVEIQVESDAVRLDAEIGLQDLEAFSSLIPDETRRRMGLDDLPYPDRVENFLDREFVILADGQPLSGELVEITPTERIRRDEITGEPLPPDGESETVIKARLRWPLPKRPEQLEFRLELPASASVGFVVDHEGIAVNDFRYMTQSQVLNLDWDDPWYSAFTTRTLRRQYYAPMAGFIYVEPYEVRKEIIVRPRDLERYIDLGLTGQDIIPVERQAEIRQKVIAFLEQHHPVTIDGEPAEPAMARADFLERTLRTSRVIDPPEDLDVDAAIMGVKFIYPHPGFADSVTMRWDLFDERTQQVPASAVDPVGPMPQILDPDFDTLEWKNFIRIPVMPQLAEISTPPGPLSEVMDYSRWPLALLACLLLLRFGRSVAGSRTLDASRGIAAAIAVVLALGSWWLGGQARLNDEAARAVVTGILTNVYRAFDFRAEGDVYDALERSVSGELLRDVYLEMRRGLVLASQGGASARVKDVELVGLRALPGDGATLHAEARWRVRAAVGHWGHMHERRNEYQANLALEPVDGSWKLVGVQILDEVRL